jgi:hypothetical protein
MGISDWVDTAKQLYNLATGGTAAPGSSGIPDFQNMISSKGIWYGGSALIGAILGFWMSNGSVTSTAVGATLATTIVGVARSMFDFASENTKNEFNSKAAPPDLKPAPQYAPQPEPAG